NTAAPRRDLTRFGRLVHGNHDGRGHVQSQRHEPVQVISLATDIRAVQRPRARELNHGKPPLPPLGRPEPQTPRSTACRLPTDSRFIYWNPARCGWTYPGSRFNNSIIAAAAQPPTRALPSEERFYEAR